MKLDIVASSGNDEFSVEFSPVGEITDLPKHYPMRLMGTTGEVIYFDVHETELQNVINQLTEILEKKINDC